MHSSALAQVERNKLIEACGRIKIDSGAKMTSVRTKAWLFLLLAVATVKAEAVKGRVMMKTLNEELLDHAQEKIDLHAALGHKHPSMTNSLLRSKEMDEILNEGDYRAVGGNRGDGSGDEEKVDKKASKSPKGQAKGPTAAPASSVADELPSKGSSTKSSGPKTLGPGDKSPKEMKGKRGESSGIMENKEDKPEEAVPQGSGDDGPGQGGNSTTANATQINQEEVFSGKFLMNRRISSTQEEISDLSQLHFLFGAVHMDRTHH